MTALQQFSNHLAQPQVPPPYGAAGHGAWRREQPIEQQRPPRPLGTKDIQWRRGRALYLSPPVFGEVPPDQPTKVGTRQIEWLRSGLLYVSSLASAEVPLDQATKGLEDVYVIEDRSAVAAFIEEHRLHGLLLQARHPLNAAFGERAIKMLTIVRDDEGFETLFCLVMVPGDMQEARRALRAFDQQWWLARCEKVAGKLNFDFELV